MKGLKGFKWHWGWSILTVFILFVVVFMYAFFRSLEELKTNEMTVEDYYTAELQYGEVLARKQRADTMRRPVNFVIDRKGLTVEFPSYWPPERVKGTLVLYRPNKKLFDRHIPLRLDSLHRLSIPRDSLLPGRWDARLSWQVDTVKFYVEKNLWLD